MTFDLQRLVIMMSVVKSYSKYVDELMHISDLYQLTMKHASKKQQQLDRQETVSADAMN